MVSRLLIGGISLYRRVVSPLLPQSCRFYPSCSEYAIEAIRTHGAITGAGFSLRRISRCHPWSVGGPDPVPRRNA